ncbi:hypothetical protein ACHAW6_011667 [Cyclotella cf. meneghiniana]
MTEYCAPEMLWQDRNGKQMMQDQMIDWISFGCMLAEFISGMNPFRSEKALNFGLTKTNDQLQSSSSGTIDCAVLRMKCTQNLTLSFSARKLPICADY